MKQMATMNKQPYYYLVSGLPDLAIGETYLPFSCVDFLRDLEYKLQPNDLALIYLLYYPRDHRNLINILFQKDNIWLSEGRYCFKELREGIEDNTILPEYMNYFISTFKEKKDRYTQAEWETRLTEAYFAEIEKSRNKFLKQWAAFEANLKNSLLIFSHRKHPLPFSTFVVEISKIGALCRDNQDIDFSAEPELDFLDQVKKIVSIEDLVVKEKKIDLLRWKKVEEMTFFKYFSVEKILCFIIKLMIIERWVRLGKIENKDTLPSILLSIAGKQHYQTLKDKCEPVK